MEIFQADRLKLNLAFSACTMVITVEKQMSKKTFHSVKFKFVTKCRRQQRFSQNERRRADLHNVA